LLLFTSVACAGYDPSPLSFSFEVATAKEPQPVGCRKPSPKNEHGSGTGFFGH